MKTIMKFTGTALKNLFNKPVTTSYPETPAVYPEATRGHVEIDFDKCILCSICTKACPPRALDVDKRSGNWIINNYDCIQCGYCAINCPKDALKMVPGYTTPAYKKQQTIFHKEVEKTYPVMDESLCVYCTLCAKKCPAGAINVDRQNKVWELHRTLCMSCGLCSNNCPKHCIEMKTESKDKFPHMNVDSCVYCTLCSKKCPVGALTVDRKEKVWKVDRSKCIACGLCEGSCPKKSIELLTDDEADKKKAKAEEAAAKVEAPVVEANTDNGAKEAEATGDSKYPVMNSETCVYCTLCAKKCPAEALAVDRTAKTWTLDKEKCIACGLCETSCPKKSITLL